MDFRPEPATRREGPFAVFNAAAAEALAAADPRALRGNLHIPRFYQHPAVSTPLFSIASDLHGNTPRL